MAGIKDRLIQFVLRGKDELSPAAEAAAEAMAELSKEAEELGQALDTAKDTRGLVNELSATERELAKAESALERGAAKVAKLREELDASPKSKALATSLREAEKEVTRAEKAIDALKPAAADLSTALSMAGVDTKRLAEEEKRLVAEIDRAKRALTENAAAASQLRREESAASRTTAEMGVKQKAAAAAARELLAGQREGAAATEAYSSAMASGAKRLAAYAVGFFGLTTLLARTRDGIQSMLSTGDQFELLGKRLTALMGSLAGGEQATAWIKQFAKDTPLAVGDVTEAFAQLKAYGLDPMDGTLQALVDQNEKLGGGQERLLGIVSAVGQAWGKQKLQTEEILQLVERGVPVWDMLARVTGKNTAQLQDMASQGQLTRDTIKSLVEEIGRSSQGAAASSMGTLSGLVSNLGDVWTGFLNRVAKSGALDYVKKKLDGLLASVEAMEADGSLDRLAQRFSDTFVAVGQSIEGAGKWVAAHTTAIKTLAAAYAAFKIAGMVTSMAQWAVSLQRSSLQMKVLRAETDAAAAATARLGAAQTLSAVKGALMAKTAGGMEKFIGVLASGASRLAGWVGLAMLAADAGKPLGEMFAKMSPAVREAEAAVARMNEQLRQQASAAADAADQLSGAADIQLKSVAELRKASDDERSAYQAKLQALEDYRKAQMTAAVLGNEVAKQDLANIETSKDANEAALNAAQAAATAADAALKGAVKGLADVRSELANVSQASQFAGDALKGNLTAGALGLIEQFNELKRSGQDVDDVLATLGSQFDPRNADQLRDMGVALQYLGQYGLASGEQIQAFLIDKLKGLSGQDLVRVQQVAQEVFDGMARGAGALGTVIDSSLNSTLAKLGVDIEGVRTGFDKATRDTIAAFDDVVAQQAATGLSAQENAAIITAAYVAARQKIDDPAAMDQLDAAFKKAATTAGMTSTQITSGMAKARGDVDQVSKSIRDMDDALQRIGSATSTMELANIGVAASKAFHEGRMSAEQYGKVQDALKAKTTELGTATKKLGDDGKEAGDKLTKSQEMYNKALEDGIVSNEELRRISGQRMEEERKNGDDTKRDMTAMGDFFGGVMTRAREPLAAMSAEALAMFDRMRGVSSSIPPIDTSNLDATRQSLQQVTKALAGLQSQSGSPFTSSIGKWQLATQRASLETQQAFLSQKASLQSLMASYESGAMTTRQFVAAASGAKRALGLLDDSDLSSLESAIRSAKQQMQQMEQSTRSTLEGLQDELDQLQGREEGIERRRFAARQRELQAQLAEAQAGGNTEAVANAQRALGLLRQVEAETAQQRQREEQQKLVDAQKAATEAAAPAAATAAPAPPAAPAKVIRLESSRGKTVDVALQSDTDETNLLSILEDAGMRSI